MTARASRVARHRGGAPAFRRFAQAPGLGLCWIGLLAACGAAREATRVELPVMADASQVLPAETELGYVVELEEARLIVRDLEFALGGEPTARAQRKRAYDFLIPSAHAHPGHTTGGDVIGELRGRFLVNYLPGTEQPLGMAVLLTSQYTSGNFAFSQASAEDALLADDVLLGHTAILRGQASRAGVSVPFAALLDSSAELQGAPFQADVREATRGVLQLRLLTLDAQGVSLFDGIDFDALAEDAAPAQLLIGSDATQAPLRAAYTALLTRLESHDHFEWALEPIP
jgi:hypothetical protein